MNAQSLRGVMASISRLMAGNRDYLVELDQQNGDGDLGISMAAGFAAGSESTRAMKSVHGRAAYYGEKSIGVLDGGSVAGKLIFEGISDWVNKRR